MSFWLTSILLVVVAGLMGLTKVTYFIFWVSVFIFAVLTLVFAGGTTSTFTLWQQVVSLVFGVLTYGASEVASLRWR